TADWWFVSITMEVPDERPVNTHPPVGIDVGLNRLATLSDGKRYENQKPLHHLLKRLCRLNKELARRTRGGKNWLKTKSKLVRLREVGRFYPSRQALHRCGWRRAGLRLD